MRYIMIKKIVVGLLTIITFSVISCESDNKEKVSNKTKKEVKLETDAYQQKLSKNKVKSIKAIAVQYKFGEPSDERIHLYQTNYNEKGYLVDSITFRNNVRVAKESIEYGKDNKIIKRALYDSSEVLISLLERELNKNGDEISFKSFMRDTLRYSQKKAYNDKNQLIKITDYYNDGSIKNISKYGYNTKGEVITKTELNELGTILYKQTIGYDSEGRKVSEIDYDSTGVLIGKTLIKNYDVNDNVQLIEKYDSRDSLYAKYEFEYNSAGEETKNTIYNGLNQILRQSYTKYDENGNRVSFKLYEGEFGLKGTDLTSYNKDNLETETKILDHENQLKHKKIKEYNEKNLLIKEVNFNHLDEPEFEFIYEYIYYK